MGDSRSASICRAVFASVSSIAKRAGNRISQLPQTVRRRNALRKLNARYYDRLAHMDEAANLLTIMFFDKHRAYFNRQAEYYKPNVKDRGDFLLRIRKACFGVIGMLLLADLLHERAIELETLDPVEADIFLHLADEQYKENREYFAVMKRADIPINLIIAEYEAAS